MARESETGFSRRIWIFFSRSWRARGTWVWFGVQIMAASGGGVELDERRASREGWQGTLKEDAMGTAEGDGSMKAMRFVSGCAWTDWA